MGESAGPEPSDVVEALTRAGHLLEQQVATQLQSLGFNCVTGKAFNDPDEGKSRELDVMGYRQVHSDDKQRLQIGCRLLVECKNTSAPYAFLTRPRPRNVARPEELFFPREYVEGAGRSLAAPFDRLGLADDYWGASGQVRAVHVSRLDRKGGAWQASNTSIFDSIVYPLAKALRHFRPAYSSRYRTQHDSTYVELCLPVAVITSRFFAVDGTSDRPTAAEVDYIRLERDLRAKSLTGLFPVDFVRYAALSEFITKRVMPFCETLSSVVTANLDIIRGPLAKT